MTEALKYPIGKYMPQPFSKKEFEDRLAIIKNLPQHVENAILNLDEAQLNTPYREGGWMVKQLVHHIADSHMNAYMRFKLGLTENNPTIKTYDEVLWAQLKDSLDLPVNISITLLHALHSRWHYFLKNLSEVDLQKKLFHPEQKKEISLWYLLGMYAWHSSHHVAHITKLRERMKW